MFVLKGSERIRCYEKTLRQDFSVNITEGLFNNCYEFKDAYHGFEYSQCFRCNNASKSKCLNVSEYKDTPFLHHSVFTKELDEYMPNVFIKGASNTSDHDLSFHEVEDLIARDNCKGIVILQSVWREQSNRMGKVARVLLSPVVYDEDEKYDIYDYYRKDKDWPLVAWSPSFEELFDAMDSDKSKVFVEMMETLAGDIYNIDPVRLVEDYIENVMKLKRDDNWNIKEFHERYYRYNKGNLISEDYEFNIDCRLLFSLIKQIMIIEDELYPIKSVSDCEGEKMIVKGRFKIIEAFKAYCNDYI